MYKDVFWFYFIAVIVIMGFVGGVLADRKNRNIFLWGCIGMMTGLLGILVLACSRTLKYDKEADIKESDDLGGVFFVVSLVIQIISLHYFFKIF